VRLLLAILLLGAIYSPAEAQQSGISVIGPGCTTFAYIDRGCKPCGVGYKSSASYPVTENPPAQGTTAFYTLGDTPDAEPNSPTVCTAAQWESKWGWNSSETSASCTGGTSPNNAVMQTYLSTDFVVGNHQIGFTNNSNIYYLSLSGTVGSGTKGCPEAPYGTWAPIATALSTVTQNFTGTATLVSGSPIITITGSCTGTLGRGSLLTTTSGIPANDYVRQQIQVTSGSAGCDGTYLTGVNATASTTETVHAGIYPGGVVVIRGGTWSGCTSSTPASPCLSFQAQTFNGGNPAWFPSASPSGWLLITSFPGESVQIISGSNSGDVFDFWLSKAGEPGNAACCVIINGLAMSDPKFGNGSQGAIFTNFTTDLIIQNNEFAGWDKLAFGNGSARILVINNVFHEMYSHGVYEDWNTGCAQSNPGVDTDFSKDLSVNILQNGCGASFNETIAYNVIYDSGKDQSDILHINGWTDAGIETDNIISYSGYPISMQEGNYNNVATGNLLFDNAAECYLAYTFANYYSTATFSSGTNQIAVTTIPTLPGAGTTFGALGYYVFGSGIPQANLPNATTLTAVASGSGSGTYTLSANTTAVANGPEPLISGGNNGASNNPGPSTERYNSFNNNLCWMGNPADVIFGGSPGNGILVYDKTGLSYHKNDTFNNNVFVTYDTSAAPAAIPIQFYVGSAQSGGVYTQPLNAGDFPETHTITGNSFYNIGTYSCSAAGSNCRIAYADPGSSQKAPWLAGGTFTATTFAAQFSGNTYLGSIASNPSNNPTPGAQEANAQSPGLFYFPPKYMVQ
jgi:hypothetical protein